MHHFPGLSKSSTGEISG